MPLTSPRFASNPRIQAAARNAPAMGLGESGQPVQILQQALIDLGFPLPVSVRRTGTPDGIYGGETQAAVAEFQRRNRLSVDGIAGQQTFGKLDQLLRSPAAPPPPAPSSIPYLVPGMKTVLAQPSPMGCWATVYCMMRSWRDQVSIPIRDCVLRVGQRWADYYDASFATPPQGLPSTEFGPFLLAARMTHEPMMNITIEEWGWKLREHGLLWIGASVTTNPNTGLHSRILEGIRGDGQATGTYMKIIDPAGGRQYEEQFAVFLAKYESGFLSVSGDYFQIRHF